MTKLITKDKKYVYESKSYSILLEKYRNHGISFLNQSNLNEEEFLSFIAESFLENSLFNKVTNALLYEHIKNQSTLSRISDKVNECFRLEYNTIFIPYKKIADMINMSIFLENEHKTKAIESIKHFVPKKMSDIIDTGVLTDYSEQISEDMYTEDQIKEYFYNIAKEKTKNIEVSGEYLVITFS